MLENCQVLLLVKSHKCAASSRLVVMRAIAVDLAITLKHVKKALLMLFELVDAHVIECLVKTALMGCCLVRLDFSPTFKPCAFVLKNEFCLLADQPIPQLLILNRLLLFLNQFCDIVYLALALQLLVLVRERSVVHLLARVAVAQLAGVFVEVHDCHPFDLSIGAHELCALDSFKLLAFLLVVL